MAIRNYYYTVKEDGITPATEQRVSLQTENAVAKLVFKLESGLYTKLEAEKGSGKLVYRFDYYDDAGGNYMTDTAPLETDTVTFTVDETVTRYGGKATVYLVITAVDENGKTALEMLSYPARLRIEGIPERVGGSEARESLSALAETAKTAADTAVEAKNKTVLAQTALETGSEFYFDGNLCGKVALVVDDTLNEASENAIMNKAVALKFGELEKLIASAVSAEKAETLLAAHPVGSLYFSSESTSPDTLFGGIWERVKDKFILAAGDDYVAGNTGGEAVHTLTANEIPEHKHRYWMANQYLSDNSSFEGVYYPVQMPNKAPTTTNYTETVGAGEAHNNMPPYEVFYCWKRIA